VVLGTHAGWLDLRQRLIAGHVIGAGRPIVPSRYNAPPVSRYPAKGSPHTKNDETINAPQARAVPKSATINAGVIAATLIACMAAMPCRAGSRARAPITKAENAKKTPATTPHPRAATNVSANRKPPIDKHP
jgi:hypothetical protein